MSVLNDKRKTNYIIVVMYELFQLYIFSKISIWLFHHFNEDLCVIKNQPAIDT